MVKDANHEDSYQVICYSSIVSSVGFKYPELWFRSQTTSMYVLPLKAWTRVFGSVNESAKREALVTFRNMLDFQGGRPPPKKAHLRCLSLSTTS